MTDLIPVWDQCECCDDYVCNVHPGQHVHDCSCHGIDEWVEHDVFPYAPCLDLEGNIVNDMGVIVPIDTTYCCV